MSILSDLAEAWPLALIAGGVGFVVAFGRDPKADEHPGMSDYREPAAIPAPRKPWAEMDAKADIIWNRADTRRVPLADILPAVSVELVDILPPAPAGMDAGSPLWRELVVEAAVPTLSNDEVHRVADEWLREIAAEQRTLAGAR